MSKAEELKQEFIETWLDELPDINYQDDDNRTVHINELFKREFGKFLEQYTEQESREQDEWVAVEFATTYFTLGIPREHVFKCFNEWYDEWKSKQEQP